MLLYQCGISFTLSFIYVNSILYCDSSFRSSHLREHLLCMDKMQSSVSCAVCVLVCLSNDRVVEKFNEQFLSMNRRNSVVKSLHFILYFQK